MTEVIEYQPVTAIEGDRAALTELGRMLSEGGEPLLLVGRAGERAVALPDAVARLLRGAVHHLARGRAIACFPVGEALTTQEAAEILNVSRPHVVKLLERGEIPFERVTSHRRIKPEDLLAYQRRRDAEREQHLSELERVSEQIGLYDHPVRPDGLAS